MALTLTEASKLSNDVLLSGVIETIVNESPRAPAHALHRNSRQLSHLQPGECRPDRRLLQRRRRVGRVHTHL